MSIMKTLKSWLDLEDAQQFLGVNRITIWRWCKKGLPSTKIGRQVFFRKADLLQWRKFRAKGGEKNDEKGTFRRERGTKRKLSEDSGSDR